MNEADRMVFLIGGDHHGTRIVPEPTEKAVRDIIAPGEGVGCEFSDCLEVLRSAFPEQNRRFAHIRSGTSIPKRSSTFTRTRLVTPARVIQDPRRRGLLSSMMRQVS